MPVTVLDRTDAAVDFLLTWGLEHEWRGYDPFDGLRSPLFRRSPLSASRWSRLAWLQPFKRSPINLRPVAGITKSLNPKGVALYASGVTECLRGPMHDRVAPIVDELLRTLCRLRSDTHGSGGWGYNFDWQSRCVPDEDALVHNVNLLAASFLLRAGRLTGKPRWVEVGLETPTMTTLS